LCIGEYFVQKYDGCWFVNDIATSQNFARYVVGEFVHLNHSGISIDPFELAAEFVNTPTPRNLTSLLNEVDDELSQL
jgi:hypothetical protein